MIQSYIDHHVHTEFSPDSVSSLVGYLEKGNRELMLTDHIDIGSPDPMFEELIDYDLYFNYVRMLEKKYDARISIGVEMGYQPDFLEETEAFVKKHPFDFVIGSIHFGDGLDFYNGDFFKGKTQQEAYHRYFEVVLDMVKHFDDFDVVGHLDYITRYGDYKNKWYDYNEYKGIIDEILTILIEKGKGIEINTSGMRKDLNIFHPKEEILKRYRELGGEIITLGSDSHDENDYASHFNEASLLLKKCGYSEIMMYRKRKWMKFAL
jgi:histidinol-phosphatase (PHP family)